MIECKGRNGYFRYSSSDVWCIEDDVRIEVFSKKIGDSPPMVIEGHKNEIKALLKKWYDAIDSDKKYVYVI